MRRRYRCRQHATWPTHSRHRHTQFIVLRRPRYLLIITNDPLGQCNQLQTCAREGLHTIAGILSWSIENGYGNITYEEGRESTCSPNTWPFANSHTGHIACMDYCCAYYQNGASGTVEDTLSHIQNLQDFGCKGCGSDPIQKGGPVRMGELTVNWVESPNCRRFHLCPPSDDYTCSWDLGQWNPLIPEPTIPEGADQDC